MTAYVDEADLLDIVMGPVVGLVTETTATILFEFNRDIRKLNLLLQPIKPVGSGSGLASGGVGAGGVGLEPGAGVGSKQAPGQASTTDKKESKKGKRPKDVMLTLVNVEAYKAVVFKAKDLVPGCLYDIFLPDFSEDRHLGSVRTVSKVPMYVQVVVTGGCPCDDLAVVNQIVSFINKQQVDARLSLTLAHTY